MEELYKKNEIENLSFEQILEREGAGEEETNETVGQTLYDPDVQTTHLNNIMLGNDTGKKITTGTNNTFFGFQAGFSNKNGSNNTFLGYLTGYDNISGSSNLFLGADSGGHNVNGSYNTFVGWACGHKNIDGTDNIFIGGQLTGYNNASGSNNIFIGTYTGYTNTGDGNIYIGNSAGITNSSGSNNIFLGKYAGYHETGSDKLFIDNTSRTTEGNARLKALIYGIFASTTANQHLYLNGNVYVSDTLTIGGTAISSLYQPLDAVLTAIAGLSSADSNIIVGSAGGWVAESGATARTSLGLGTTDSVSFAVTTSAVSDATVYSATAYDHANYILNNAQNVAGSFTAIQMNTNWSDGTTGWVILNAVSSAAYSSDLVIQTRNAGNTQESMRVAYNGTTTFSSNSVIQVGSSPEFIIKGTATSSLPQLSWYENTTDIGAFMQYRGSGASSPKVFRLGTYISGGTVEIISGNTGVAVVTIDANVNNTGVYKVDGTQVVGNRVIDARCDDAINSGDASTDGVIDCLRDAMISHGLIAAS